MVDSTQSVALSGSFTCLFDVLLDVVAEVERIAGDKSKNDEQQRYADTRKDCVRRFPEVGQDDDHKHTSDEPVKRNPDAVGNVAPRLSK